MKGSTQDLRPGAIIMYNKEMCEVLESEHRTPGNLRAFYQVKMRSMRTGKLQENRFRSGENIEFVRLERRPYQYLYKDGVMMYFMEPDTYEQIPVNVENVNKIEYLKENEIVQLAFVDDEVIQVEVPKHVNLEITHTEPGVRGDTATNVMKPATLETGVEVQVPLFINEGDTIRVDTESGTYIERVKD
jgi:elongation factor P